METDLPFLHMAALLCEPVRATMLWNLLDGRAYTASELALLSESSPTAASNHLSKLVAADLLKVEVQGRHRYYSFARPEVAYVVESLASLTSKGPKNPVTKPSLAGGIRYCRSCYDHLAGYVGVHLTEALIRHQFLRPNNAQYTVTPKGWDWFSQLDLTPDHFGKSRRPLARPCLDWSERRPHLAGLLGAALLDQFLQRRWVKRTQFSRELLVTAHGHQALEAMAGPFDFPTGC